LLLIWMERHGQKYRSHVVMQSPSMKPRSVVFMYC
jgi:hypothetical protein